MTRPWPFSFAGKEFPQRWKVVKQAKYLLEGKRAKYMWTDTRGGLLRVSLSRALMVVWVIITGHFLWFSSDRSFWFARFRVHIWRVSGSSRVHTRISQPRWIPPQRLMGSWRQLTSLPFDPQGVFLRMCGQGRLLTWRMRLCGLGRTQPPTVTKSNLAQFTRWYANKSETINPRQGVKTRKRLYLEADRPSRWQALLCLVVQLYPRLFTTPWTI